MKNSSSLQTIGTIMALIGLVLAFGVYMYISNEPIQNKSYMMEVIMPNIALYTTVLGVFVSLLGASNSGRS